MELLNNQTKSKNLKFYFRYSAAVVMSMFLFVACQKSNSNNNVATPMTVYPNQVVPGNCANCNFPQAQLYQVTTTQGGINGVWQFIGNQQLMTYMSYPKIYSGAFFARGTLSIAAGNYNYGGYSGILAGQCILPVGQYTINPISVGTMNNGIFELQQFEAIQGNVRIVFGMSGQIKDPNGDGQVDGIFAQLYAMQAMVNGSMMTCNDNIGIAIQ